MLDEKSLLEELVRWVEDPEAILNCFKKHNITVNQTVYVVTRWTRHAPYEVITCTTNTLRYSDRTNCEHISASGRYASGSYYTGTFRSTSRNKTLFTDKQKALDVCAQLNKGETR